MDPRIVQAMRFLEEQSDQHIDYEGVASAIGLSLYRFYHLFAEETGQSPGCFVRSVRLNAAAMWLRWTHETAGRIANNFGYHSQSSFNSAFQRHFGGTPGRLRKESQGRAATLVGGRRISVRECFGFHCFAKQYTGPTWRVRSHWADFIASLPPSLGQHGRYLYLTVAYDRLTHASSEQSLSDCCVVLSEKSDGARRVPEDGALRSLVTRAGLFACIDHVGGYASLPQTYDTLMLDWLPASGFSLTDDPPIELHVAPASRVLDHELRFLVLLPLKL